MNTLNPKKVSVKIYRWDDANAVRLDKTANCMQMIFKSCLVTGYGSKQGAGWTSEFDGTVNGVTVLRAKQGVEQDFYLRLSGDIGTEMTAQVYTAMTDANTGTLKLQCDTPFKYAIANSTGKWLLLATERSFWFFCEQHYTSDNIKSKPSKTGAWFFCGDTAKNTLGRRATVLMHTGGSWSDGDYGSMTTYHREYLTGAVNSNKKGNTPGKLYSLVENTVYDTVPLTLFNGLSVYADRAILSPFFVTANQKMYCIPGLYIPAHPDLQNNFDAINVEGVDMIVMSSSGGGVSNVYLQSTAWDY